jgi:galactose-1-phosphate uridylyltransferase
MPQRITCKDTTWLVSEARDRSLSEEEQQNLRQHISECPFCQGASKQFEVLFRQLGDYLKGANVGK